MLKSILSIILGLTEVMTIIIFSLVYSVSCIIFAWLPDLSFLRWTIITLLICFLVIGISLVLYFFTSYTESIHSWILLPGIIVGKIWILATDHNSFDSLLLGTIIISLIFIFLVLGEIIRTWNLARNSENTVKMELRDF